MGRQSIDVYQWDHFGIILVSLLETLHFYDGGPQLISFYRIEVSAWKS